MYEEFKHPNNPWLYVYIEAPVQLLQMQVPVDATNSKKNIVYDEEGNEISFELKNIYEYLSLSPVISLDGTKAIVLLNESQEPRLNGVSEEDIIFWDNHLQPYGLGYNSGSWMGLDGSECINKVSSKLNSIEYYNGENV